MNNSAKTFLQTEACRVTEEEVVVESHRYPIQKVSDARVVAESSYQSKTFPFMLAVVFVVWTLSELVNGADDYTYAIIAGVLAVLSMVAVRVVGRFQKHAAWLTMPEGSVAVFRSHDRAAVADLVKAVKLARAARRSQFGEAWQVGKPISG